MNLHHPFMVVHLILRTLHFGSLSHCTTALSSFVTPARGTRSAKWTDGSPALYDNDFTARSRDERLLVLRRTTTPTYGATDTARIARVHHDHMLTVTRKGLFRTHAAAVNCVGVGRL